jgi:3-oxoacyl-[acyl-carrier protein] reductase
LIHTPYCNRAILQKHGLDMTSSSWEHLRGRRAVVAGGTGEIGDAIVRVLLSHGMQVVVPARNAAAAVNLWARQRPSEGLSVIECQFGTVHGAMTLRDEVLKTGGIDAVVASVGGWWQGAPLVETNPEDWDRIVASNLTSHYAIARAFLPVLPNDGTYLQLLGGAADHPVPGASLVSITAAACSMMGSALARESVVRVLQLQIDSFVATRGSRARAEPGWLTDEDVARTVADMLANPSTQPAKRTIANSSAAKSPAARQP